MNKQAFIESLKANLSFLSPTELDDVIAEFEEHFEVGVERGYTEQQLIDQLGDPAQIAASYRAEVIDRNGIKVDAKTPEAPDVQWNGQTSGGSDRQSRFVATDIHERYNAADVKRIVIDTAHADVKIVIGNESEVLTDVETVGTSNITAEFSGGTLLIKQDTTSFRWLSFLSSFSAKVCVTIPPVLEGALSVKVLSGGIGITQFKGDSLSIKSTAGDVRLGEVFSQDNIDIHSTAGNIVASKCVAQSVEIDSRAGDIVIDALTAVDASIVSTAGNIRSGKNCFWETKRLSVKSLAGDVKLALNDYWRSVQIQSTAGNIRLILPDNSAPFDVQQSLTVGSFKSEFQSVRGADRTIMVKSTAGDVRIKRA